VWLKIYGSKGDLVSINLRVVLRWRRKRRRIHDSNAQVPHGRCRLMRVNSANVLDEGLRIGGRGRRMNSKVRIQTNKAKLDVYWDKTCITSSILMCPWVASPGPCLWVARSRGTGRVRYKLLYMTCYNIAFIFDYNYTSASFLGLCSYGLLSEQTSWVPTPWTLVFIPLSTTNAFLYGTLKKNTSPTTSFTTVYLYKIVLSFVAYFI
jgi:hypothetical protein